MNRIATFSILIVFFGILTSFIYKEHFLTFYQQDEWLAVGFAQENGSEFLFKHSFFQTLGGTGRIPGTAISIFFLKYLPFEIWPFSVFAIGLHAINSMLAFLMSYLVTKRIYIAIISGIFFCVASISDQAVIWAGAITNVLPSTLFTFLCVCMYLMYLKKKKTVFFISANVLAFIAYYFRESSMFLFLLLPALFFVHNSHISFVRSCIMTMKKHWMLGVFVLFIVLVRFSFLQGSVQDGYFVTNNTFIFEKLISHAFFYPLTAFSQMYLHPGFLFPFSKIFESIYFPYVSQTILSPAVYEFVVADMISVVLSFLLILFFSHLAVRKKQYRYPIIFSAMFIVLSILPYIILDKPNAFLESRYYYTSVLGAGLLLGVIADYFTRFFSRKIHSYVVGVLFVGFVLTGYFLQQIQWMRTDLSLQVTIAEERRNFFSQLSSALPQLPPTSVLYFTGTQDYYTPGNKIPFQLGPGFILMSYYYQTGVIPNKLIQEQFLAHLFAQGYREVNGRGFGYYREFEKLAEDALVHDFPVERVYAFSYNGTTRSLINISGSVRKDLHASREAQMRR